MHLPQGLGLALFALAPLPLAQGVHVVDDSGGPGVDFTSLPNAVAAAQDGDIVLVRSGSYSGDLIVDGRSISIVADGGAAVQHTGRIAFLNLAVGQTALLAGVDLTPPAGGSFGALDVVDCAGTVWIEDVTIDALLLHIVPHMVSVDSSSAVFSHCSISGGTFPAPSGNPGLRATDADVHLFHTTIVGGHGYGGLGGPFVGGTGLVLSGGFLSAQSSEVRGGQGTGVGSPFGCQGVSGAGGIGLHLASGNPTARLFDTDLVGGEPGALSGSGSCTQGPAGPPLVVDAGAATQTPWNEHHFSLTSPVVHGQTVVATASGQPGDFLWIVFSNAAAIQYFPIAAAPLVVGAPAIVPIGALDATGTAAIPFPSFVPPGAEGKVYYAQPLFLDGEGRFTLGEPAHVLELAP